MATRTPPEEIIEAVPVGNDQSQHATTPTPVIQEGNEEAESNVSDSREAIGPQEYAYTTDQQRLRPRLTALEHRPSVTRSSRNGTRSRLAHHSEHLYEGDGETSRPDPGVHRNRAYGATENGNLLQEERRNSEPSVGDYELVEPVAQEHRSRLFTMNMKNYIFSTLCVSKTKPYCTCFGLIFYISLFMWGVTLFVGSIAVSKEELSKEGGGILELRVLTMLAGSFFIFLGFYWILVYWWSKVSRGSSRVISFSVITALWFCLCMYFIGVASALAAEIHEHPDQAFREYFNTSNTSSSDTAAPPFPLLAISSMALLWIIFVFNFAVNIIVSCKDIVVY